MPLCAEPERVGADAVVVPDSLDGANCRKRGVLWKRRRCASVGRMNGSPATQKTVIEPARVGRHLNENRN